MTTALAHDDIVVDIDLDLDALDMGVEEDTSVDEVFDLDAATRALPPRAPPWPPWIEGVAAASHDAGKHADTFAGLEVPLAEMWRSAGR